MLCGMCRIVVFSVRVLKDERIVVVAEQRPECTEEQVRLQLFTLHYKYYLMKVCRFISHSSIANNLEPVVCSGQLSCLP